MDCLTFKKANCQNCHKCIRYCPVKSIRFSEDQAYIIGNQCILCGQCFLVCPQDAARIKDETDKVREWLQQKKPVIVSLDSSFVANYKGVSLESMRAAICRLGFSDVEETAMGATIVKNELERMVREKQDIIITSCCPSVNLLIQKHFPEQLPCLAPVLSPMQAHCLEIKRRYPQAKTVFIGPCISKKDEARRYEGLVDAVLTFEELTDWFKAEHVKLSPDTKQEQSVGCRSRLFATTGGIIKAMTEKNPEYTFFSVDGVENCMAVLKEISNDRIHRCFIEMSACVGGCIGGPAMERFTSTPVENYIAVSKNTGEETYTVDQPSRESLYKEFRAIKQEIPDPSEEDICKVLLKMGKTDPSKEINCGSCGYNTCRERAIAVCQGKSGTTMCMPYLKEKAERFSDNIVHSTPTGLLVLNEQLEVQQINEAALDLLQLPSAEEAIGTPVLDILDPEGFQQVLGGGDNIDGRRFYLAQQGKYVEETIVYDEDSRLLICMLHDVTGEETQREQKHMISRQTVEIADRVVDKQMRVVQEIASLLGETVAETKIALTKLKESIVDE